MLEGTLDYLGLTTSDAAWLEYVESAGFGEDCAWPAWRAKLVNRLEVQSGEFPQHLTAALRSVCLTLMRQRDAFASTTIMPSSFLKRQNVGAS